MDITFNNMAIIHKVMGRHADLLKVEGDKLHLCWWNNNGSKSLVVDDFNGHRNYFDPFIKKVLLLSEEFNTLHGDEYMTDSEGYLGARKAYLGY